MKKLLLVLLLFAVAFSTSYQPWELMNMLGGMPPYPASNAGSLPFTYEYSEQYYTDTATVIVLDSIGTPDSGRAGATIKIYCRGAKSTQGSSTIVMGDSIPAVKSWSNILIEIFCPNITPGWYDFILTDGVIADTILNAYKVLGPAYDTCWALAGAHGSVTPAYRGDSSNNVNHALAFAATPDAHYAAYWTARHGAVISDPFANSITATILQNDTLDATFHDARKTLTMANSTPAGTISPTAGAHTLDSLQNQAISYTPPAGYGKAKPTWTFSAGVIPNSDSTSVYLTQSGTATPACTAANVYSTITVSAVGGGSTTPSGAQSVQCLHNLSIAATDAAGHHFTAWSYSPNILVSAPASASTTCHTTDSANGTVTANFDTSRYTATMATSGPGVVSPVTGTKDSAAVFGVYADSGDGFHSAPWDSFAHWTAAGGLSITSTTTRHTTAYLTAAGTATALFGTRAAIPPTLAFPANNDTGISITPMLRVNLVAVDSAYIWLVSKHSNFSDTVKIDTSTDTTKAFSLNTATNYYAKTRAKNNGGLSAFGTAITFKTTAASSGGNRDSIRIQLDSVGLDTIKLSTVTFDSGFTITKPVRCNYAHFTTTDSMTINKPIYVRDSVVFESTSKVGALSGSKLLPFAYPPYKLVIKTNGKQNIPPVLKKGIGYNSWIVWK